MVEEVDQAALLKAEREAFTAIYGLHKSACAGLPKPHSENTTRGSCPWCYIGAKLWESSFTSR